MKRVLYILIIFLFAALATNAQFYSGSQMDFGKNRVQYTPRIWTYYDYDNYQVYFYEGGKELANYVSYSAKKNIADIETTFDYKIDDKIIFIVYNKLSDLEQSNIGLVSDEPYNIGGVTQIVGNKVQICFEGDHQKLDKMIRAGIAEVTVNQMMYGGSVKDMVKNSTLLALPEWYVKGLVSYISEEWSVEMDDKVKDKILSGSFNKFNRLAGADAVMAGHAVWRYVADMYGKSVISNIVYMTKVTRNIESAFLFVLGVSIKNIVSEWLLNSKEVYKEGEKHTSMPSIVELPKKRGKKNRVFHNMKVSPDGTQLVYVTNEMGQYKVWYYNTQTGKRPRKIMKAGHKIDRIKDLSYPLLAWHPSGKLFALIYEDKGRIMLNTYTPESKERTSRRIVNFEKILDFAYSDDNSKFAMSAVKNGQSDIYVFAVASNGFEQITKDIYDDLNPRFINNSKQIIFSSNRINDTIRLQESVYNSKMQSNKDIFIYDYASRSNVLKRVTNTPDINEVRPTAYKGNYFSYLSDKNGIRNRYIAFFDSVLSHVDTIAHYRYILNSKPVTDYSRNILEHEVDPKTGKYIETLFYKGKYRIYSGDVADPSTVQKMSLERTRYLVAKEQFEKVLVTQDSISKSKTTTQVENEEQKGVKIINVFGAGSQKEEVKPSADSNAVDINNYTFDSEKQKVRKEQDKIKSKEDETVGSSNSDSTQTTKAASDTTSLKKKTEDFILAPQRNYYINYSTDYVTSQIDNTFLNATYQRFTGGKNPVYLNPGLSGFFKIGLSDLFEDYKITTGVRLSGGLDNNEYILSYDNRLRRLDKQVILHRQAFLNFAGATNSLLKVHTHDARYILKYPFSEVACVRGTATARYDRFVYLATDYPNLREPNDHQYWASLKAEYIFDNTRKKGLNLYNGLRMKFFVEYFRQLNLAETNIVIPGMDIRYYLKVHRDIIWANRLAASTSFGDRKLVYYMGGVDAWFNPQFDNSINIANDQNYAYQTLATNMRGFYQNIRNGNSFAVLNSELRIPIFKYLISKPIKSDFINNFQIIGFGDIGTAWTGKSPYSEENSLNTTIISKPGNPITVVLDTQKQPIVGGYGWGIRSRIFGYFFRVDWAWGVEDNVILPRITYLSFTLDF